MFFRTIVFVIVCALLLRTQPSQFLMITSGTSVFDANREPCDFHGDFSAPPFCHNRTNNVQLYLRPHCSHIPKIGGFQGRCSGWVMSSFATMTARQAVIALLLVSSFTDTSLPFVASFSVLHPLLPFFWFTPFHRSVNAAQLLQEGTDCHWTLYGEFVWRAGKEKKISTPRKNILDKLRAQRAPN